MCLSVWQLGLTFGIIIRTKITENTADWSKKKRKHIFDQSAVFSLFHKQGYVLKNWVEGLSDEASYPWVSPKKIQQKSVNPTFASEKKESLDSSIKGNLWVFQNHRKEAKIVVIFYHLPSLGLNEPPWFRIFEICQHLPMKQLTSS